VRQADSGPIESCFSPADLADLADLSDQSDWPALTRLDWWATIPPNKKSPLSLKGKAGFVVCGAGSGCYLP
jgi:hypothetical protein